MNAASQDQVPRDQDSDEQALREQSLPTIGEFLAAVGATPVVVHPEYAGVPVVLLDIPGDWHEVVRDVLPNAFGAWALPAEEGSVAAASGWVENVVLMVWRLSLPVDPRAVMRCAYTDSRRLPDWVELGGDVEDYDGFPSAEISGTYTYAELSLWMSTRYLVASTPTGQYLLQLTVTTFADEIDEGVFIAESFTVQVPPARPGLGAHELRTGPHPLVSEGETGFRSGVYDPDTESRWRQAYSGDSAESFEPEVSAAQDNSEAWSDTYGQQDESHARTDEFGVESGLFASEVEPPTRSDDFGNRYDSERPVSRSYEPESYGRETDFSTRSEPYVFESSSESSGSRDESSVIGSDSVIREYDPRYPESFEPVPDPLTGPHSTVQRFEPAPEPSVLPPRPRSNAPSAGSHSVVHEFDSVVFEQDPNAGFDTPARGYESTDPDAYSAIMGIEPRPADSDPRGPRNREPDAPSTGNMDFRI
ncbi:LpqN/LpqT family lipoprotein [Nocardia miyunensis]|uniref:LpqN/LpqT family lipoprotein n=1 Tax=Nocardia miyunensis TaxID=282684 RepID=UPI000836A733|nr:LpqN/LpqT family lipoprotein [Nocardia miyunensis]